MDRGVLPGLPKEITGGGGQMTTAVQDKGAVIVSWLISPEASYVTGSDITVSGGL